MMKRHALVLAVICLATSVSGETLRSDAFGIFDAETDATRSAWAGFSTPVGAPGEAVGDGTWVAPRAAETVLLYFGEKSLSEGSGSALMAALVLDGRGNLVVDGTEVSLVAGDGRATARVENGIAARNVQAGEVSGQHFAWAETHVQGSPRQSPRVSYRVVPALPEQEARLIGPADQIRSEEAAVFDAQLTTGAGGAVALDGVAAQIVLTHSLGGHTLVPAQWIGGNLHARLLTRDISGTAEARLHLPFSASSPLRIDIDTIGVTGSIQITAATMADISATRLRLGPVTTDAGHLIHDGSLVRLSVLDAAGNHFEAQAWTLDGLTEVTVPSVAMPFAVQLHTPGGTQTQTVTHAEDMQ